MPRHTASAQAPRARARAATADQTSMFYRQITITALCALALTIWGHRMSQAQTQPSISPPERTVSVAGAGFVMADPDMAHITLGVVADADTAKAALEKNTAAMNAIVQALKASGIEAKDIQTSNFSVAPRYRQAKNGEQPTVNGYQVSNNVRIVVREIGKLGGILDQVITLGSNQIHGVGFEVSKADALRDEARKNAVVNARHKATLYATAAGAKVGRVLAIEEAGAAPVQRPYAMAARSSAMMGSAPPIEAGNQRLEAHVTVTFALE